jgi:hypothetical protein
MPAVIFDHDLDAIDDVSLAPEPVTNVDALPLGASEQVVPHAVAADAAPVPLAPSDTAPLIADVAWSTPLPSTTGDAAPLAPSLNGTPVSIAARDIPADRAKSEPTWDQLAEEPSQVAPLPVEPMSSVPLPIDPMSSVPLAIEPMLSEPMPIEPMLGESMRSEPMALPIARMHSESSEPVRIESVPIATQLGAAPMIDAPPVTIYPRRSRSDSMDGDQPPRLPPTPDVTQPEAMPVPSTEAPQPRRGRGRGVRIAVAAIAFVGAAAAATAVVMFGPWSLTDLSLSGEAASPVPVPTVALLEDIEDPRSELTVVEVAPVEVAPVEELAGEPSEPVVAAKMPTEPPPRPTKTAKQPARVKRVGAKAKPTRIKARPKKKKVCTDLSCL